MTATTPTPRRQPEVFVARQPTFSARDELFGYELLYRSLEDPDMARRDPALATSRVVAAALFSVGFDRLVGDARAFINFPRSWLLGGPIGLLPHARVVIDVVPGAGGDAPMVEACLRWRDQGYQLAIDGFVPGDPRQALLPYASMVKVDIGKVEPHDRREIVVRSLDEGRTPVAVRVEGLADFETARDEGFSLFQGYYFERPNFVNGHDIPSLPVSREWALRHAAAGAGLDEIEHVIRRDVGLVYKLLRYLREAVPWRDEVGDVRDVLEKLGPDASMQWLVLATLAAGDVGRHSELMKLSAVRGRMCEAIADEIDLRHRSFDAFLLGALTKLDRATGRPMRDLADAIDLRPDVRLALSAQDDDGPLTRILELVNAYEAGGWEAVNRLAPALGLAPSRLSDIFTRALDWANARPIAA